MSELPEIRKLETLLKLVITATIDIWEEGEGDLTVEVRDEKGIKKGKVKGGPTKRI